MGGVNLKTAIRTYRAGVIGAVVVVGDEVIIGFDRGKLQRLLEIS